MHVLLPYSFMLKDECNKWTWQHKAYVDLIPQCCANMTCVDKMGGACLYTQGNGNSLRHLSAHKTPP